MNNTTPIQPAFGACPTLVSTLKTPAPTTEVRGVSLNGLGSISSDSGAAPTNYIARGWHIGRSPEVIGLDMADNGLIVTLRLRSNLIGLTHPPRPVPDKIWQEYYRVGTPTDGDPQDANKLFCYKVVELKHIPRHEVEESIQFPK